MGESGSCRNNRIQLGGGRGEGGVEGAGRLRGMGDTILSGETGRDQESDHRMMLPSLMQEQRKYMSDMWQGFTDLRNKML